MHKIDRKPGFEARGHFLKVGFILGGRRIEQKSVSYELKQKIFRSGLGQKIVKMLAHVGSLL